MGILNKYKINLLRRYKVNYSHVVTIVVVVGLILLCLSNIRFYGMQISQWDLLLMSGAVVFIIAIPMAFKIPAKFDEMLNRLVHRGALENNTKKLENLKTDLQHSARKLAIIMGIVLAISLLLAFIYRFHFSRILITILETAGGFIAGTLFGYMCGFGRLGLLIRKHHVLLKIQPGHLDDVGGLKPVGEFYFHQAMVVAMPAVFLAVWLLFFQFGFPRYSGWKTLYAIFLSINIVLEILVFVVPLLSFHSMMVTEKQNELEEADKLSKEIAIVEHQLTREQDVQKRELIKDRLSSMTKEYWDIEKLPTWPISKRTKKLFKRNNFTLLMPLVIDIVGRTSVGQTSLWQDISGIVEKIFK